MPCARSSSIRPQGLCVAPLSRRMHWLRSARVSLPIPRIRRLDLDRLKLIQASTVTNYESSLLSEWLGQCSGAGKRSVRNRPRAPHPYQKQFVDVEDIKCQRNTCISRANKAAGRLKLACAGVVGKRLVHYRASVRTTSQYWSLPAVVQLIGPASEPA